MKFIAVLREPAERSFSAWSHMMRDGREPVDDFPLGVRTRGRATCGALVAGSSTEAMSRYGEQLAARYDAVPREQIMVVLEDLVTRQDETMAEIFAFLGLQPVEIASERVMNASGKSRFRALNHLLTQRNPVKAALKRIIPYETGTAIAQRVASWNLRRRDISDDDRRVPDPAFQQRCGATRPAARPGPVGWGETPPEPPLPGSLIRPVCAHRPGPQIEAASAKAPPGDQSGAKPGRQGDHGDEVAIPVALHRRPRTQPRTVIGMFAHGAAREPQQVHRPAQMRCPGEAATNGQRRQGFAIHAAVKAPIDSAGMAGRRGSISRPCRSSAPRSRSRPCRRARPRRCR